jgi:hypothetical protein
MILVPIVCTVFFLGGVLTLAPSVGDEEQIADLGSGWVVTTVFGALSAWTWMLYAYTRSKHDFRSVVFTAASAALLIAAMHMTVAAYWLPLDARKIAYGSVDLTLTGELAGMGEETARSFAEEWHIQPAAKLINEEVWGTSVSFYGVNPWLTPDLHIDILLDDGRTIHCYPFPLNSKSTASVDRDSVFCESSILFEDMSGVLSATVHIDRDGR